MPLFVLKPNQSIAVEVTIDNGDITLCLNDIPILDIQEAGGQIVLRGLSKKDCEALPGVALEEMSGQVKWSYIQLSVSDQARIVREWVKKNPKLTREFLDE